ncbi:L-alanine-DL-glutamate epimerase [Parapedobacter composti]|uniref:Dipeptide epimerase n=1 Tax=Parapedobacter composti TaxID=623281 RepID=A0A1I1KEJ7_9SPHI|nr:dipeptide epimerase [Parapedobacter composti]SFC59227.1 L-alanine-DL-glutamate epimerase [Parapedobacter composti]
MKIQSAHAYKKFLRLKRPYTIARSTISNVEMVFLEVVLENGMVGIGSSSTDVEVVGESADDTLANLNQGLDDLLVGRDIRMFLGLIDEVRQIFPAQPGTQAAVDLALHDAFGKWAAIPVVDFYGRHHVQLPTSVTIGIKGVTETLAEAQEYKTLGFRVLKVKTGLDVAEDAERIVKLRERFGDYFAIRVDANTGYSIPELLTFMEQVRGLDVELVEQPLPPGNEAAIRALPGDIRRMLAADESLKNARSAIELCQGEPYGIFNIKLMKCGGICGAMEIAAIARQCDIRLFWGCNDESRASITGALHAAFACPHTRYIDLDGSLDLAEDFVAGGFILQEGIMRLPDTPGLGLRLM